MNLITTIKMSYKTISNVKISWFERTNPHNRCKMARPMQKKITLTLWWDCGDIIHLELVTHNEILNACPYLFSRKTSRLIDRKMLFTMTTQDCIQQRKMLKLNWSTSPTMFTCPCTHWLLRYPIAAKRFDGKKISIMKSKFISTSKSFSHQKTTEFFTNVSKIWLEKRQQSPLKMVNI